MNYAYYGYDIDKRNPFARIIIIGEGKGATPKEPFSVQERRICKAIACLGVSYA